MRVEVVLGEELVADALRPDVGVDVVALLADDQLLEDFLGRDGVGDAHAGGDDLGERACVDDHSVGIEALDIGQILAAVAQIAVGIVLENQHAVLSCKLIHSSALFKAHGHARGVLEVRDGVDELRVGIRLELLLQLGHAHAVGLDGHADELGVVAAEGVQRADKGRCLADHDLAFVDERLGAEIHDLLRARGDEDVVAVVAGVVIFLHVLLEVVAQGGVALCHAVLEHGDGILAEDTLGNLGDRLNGERVGRRVACRKGNDLGVGGVFEDFTDGARFQIGNSVGKNIFHSTNLFFCKFITYQMLLYHI